jgi:P2-related tail formation protein
MDKQVLMTATVVDSFETNVEVDDWYEAKPEAYKKLKAFYPNVFVIDSAERFENRSENGKSVYSVLFHFEIQVDATGPDEQAVSEALSEKVRYATPSPNVMQINRY